MIRDFFPVILCSGTTDSGNSCANPFYLTFCVENNFCCVIFLNKYMIIFHCLEASKKIIFRLLSLFGIRLPIICNLLLNKKVKSDVHVLRRIIGTIIQVGGLLCTGGCTHNWPLSKRRLISRHFMVALYASGHSILFSCKDILFAYCLDSFLGLASLALWEVSY